MCTNCFIFVSLTPVSFQGSAFSELTSKYIFPNRKVHQPFLCDYFSVWCHFNLVVTLSLGKLRQKIAGTLRPASLHCESQDTLGCDMKTLSKKVLKQTNTQKPKPLFFLSHFRFLSKLRRQHRVILKTPLPSSH